MRRWAIILTFIGRPLTVLQYTSALKAKEQEEKEMRLAKLRPAIRNMLKGNPNVFHYSTFATADKLFSQHPIWQQARIESERRLIFEEYVAELKQREIVRPSDLHLVMTDDCCYSHFLDGKPCCTKPIPRKARKVVQ